jgi:monoamine oxidase
MQRRQFIKQLAGLSLLPAFGCARLPKLSRASGQKSKKVIVVGAGLAGLSAAWELEQLGHTVTVLEATQRVGGRVLTSRGYGPDNQYIEWGATRIADVHDHTLHYAKLFGLELDELAPIPRSAHYFAGVRYDHPGSAPLPEKWKLSAEERKLGLDGIKSIPLRSINELGDPYHTGWAKNPMVRALNGMSYTEYLKTLNLSDTAFRVNRFESGSDGDNYSAALWQAQNLLLMDWNRTFQIRGGNSHLPESFQKGMEASIRYGAQVKWVQRNNDGVTVHFLQQGELQTITGDAVVLTVSPVIMKGIEFSPPLSEEKQAAMREVKMGSVIKTAFGFQRRFWNEEGLRGLCVAYTDLPLERVYDLTATQKGQSGILMSYSQHHSANALRALPKKGRVLQSRKHLEKIFPTIGKHLIFNETFDWNEQDWVNGPWVSYAAHQLQHFQALQVPEPSLHFAGDHTSFHCGWMQGALESGRRVAAEIA